MVLGGVQLHGFRDAVLLQELESNSLFGHILPLLCFCFFAVARTTRYGGCKMENTQDIVVVLGLYFN